MLKTISIIALLCLGFMGLYIGMRQEGYNAENLIFGLVVAVIVLGIFFLIGKLKS